MENEFILDEQAVEKINKFTRKAVTADEVYAFAVVLCDNEIDRDNERFSIAALNGLAKLFVGKTGIFDHNPKGENQTARVFDCEVKTDSKKMTSAGEPYTYLYAYAYMMKTKKSEDLILEIDGGIKKEVSVSCQVGVQICSICGADLGKKSCAHVKGKYYGEKLCSVILDNPTDAYEWSFVAVPAQRNAGVTKRYGDFENENEVIKSLEDRLGNQSKSLSKACDLLRREIISLSFLCRPIMAVETVQRLTVHMDYDELDELYHTLKRQSVSDNYSRKFQLDSTKKRTEDIADTVDNKNFKLAKGR